MITNYNNPHEQLKPSSVHQIKTKRSFQFKIEKIQGLFTVYQHKGRNNYELCHQLRMDGNYIPAIFQTLPEAEGFISKVVSGIEVRFYDFKEGNK